MLCTPRGLFAAFCQAGMSALSEVWDTVAARPEKGGDGTPLTSVLCWAMVFTADLHLQQRTEGVLTVYMHKVDSVQEGWAF